MNITSVDISGFRAFARSQQIDLDADTVLVVGANGQGKTSLFDAILWALAGDVPRIGSRESVVSLYSPSGEARVALGLTGDGGARITVIRRFDGETTHLVLEDGESTYRGPQAENELLQRLWPDALAASEPLEALRSAVERGVYLQQDLLTSFLSADTDQERFTAISELVGTGRVTELQTTLERSRIAWSRVTNVRAGEADELADRLSRLEIQLHGMAEPQPSTALTPSAWRAWWQEAGALGLSGIEAPTLESREAAGALDAAVKQLQAVQLSSERRRETARSVLSEMETMPSQPTDDLDVLRKAVEISTAELAKAREALAAAEENAAHIRRMQVELREQLEQLRVFAELALRHLGDRCPVCEQIYDHEAAQRRLEALAHGDGDLPAGTGEMPDLAALASTVQRHEQATSAAARSLSEAERAEREWAARQAQLTVRCAELSITPDAADVRARLSQTVDELDARGARLSHIRRQGEMLALALARAGQRARQAELEREIAELRRQLESARRDVGTRQETGGLVSTMIEALREAGSDLVEEQLRRLEPLLQRIYATADPHPAFRVAKLLSRIRQGRGRVITAVADPFYELESEAPGSVLSSSQMNVLAVSVFLALNLAMPALPLRTAILDDPLQSLDDLNLLGLIDLLRRMRARRQVMISTHDARFSALLERKLRPVSDAQRTVIIEMQGWSREGPAVIEREVERDREPVRIAV